MTEHEANDGPVWSPAASAIAFLVAIVIGALALWHVQPTDPKPRTAPLNEFSAFRAHSHLLEMCVETHPTGSQAALRVREYIEQTIRDMGYEPEVQKAIVPRRTDRPPYELAYIENVIVRVPGTNPTGAFLNMAHYDSVAFGLGASDDGAGCAAMLETLRALKYHQPPRNDIIFLFTDGEEAGLLGPRAFMTHPYYKDVKTVLNFEARGYYGPSLMFELSEENGWLIDQVAEAATHPVASSIMFDAAGRMPTTTDYEVLKKAGLPGMGLAYVGGIEYYHTPNDSPEKISFASLQHHGEYGLPLVLHFGQVDLTDVRAPNKVYFDLPLLGLIRYPVKWIPMFSALGMLLVAGALMIGLMLDRYTIRAVFASLFLHLVCMVLVAVVVGGIMASGFILNQEYIVYRTYPYLFGYCALSLFVYLLALRLAGRWLSPSAFAAGALLLWLPIVYVTSNYFPGGSYIPTWPVIGMATALGLNWALGHRISQTLHPSLTLLGALPALLIITPLMYLSVISITIVPAPFWMLNFILLLSVLVPLLAVLVRHTGMVLPAGALGVAVPLLAYALMGASFTKETPKMNHLCYGMNCSTGEAFWMSSEPELDEWLIHFFNSDEQRGPVDDFAPGQEGIARRAPAPLADLPEAEVKVVEDTVSEGVRDLHLKVTSMRKAARLDIALPPELDVLQASLNGVELKDDRKEGKEDRPWRARYQGLSYDGVDLRLRVPADQPVKLLVREESFGLPPIPGINVPMRPENMVTENNVKNFWKRDIFRFRSNVLYTMKEFEIPALANAPG